MESEDGSWAARNGKEPRTSSAKISGSFDIEDGQEKEKKRLKNGQRVEQLRTM